MTFDAAIARARAALQAGRLDEARQALDEAALAAPARPEPWLFRADLARAAGDLAAFAAALGQARDRIADPALRLRLDLDRATALLHLGHHAEALAVAEACDPAADPRHAGPLGALLDALDRPDLAAPLLEQAAAQQPGQPEPWLDLAIVRRTLGDLDAAEAACERAIALRPAFSEAHALLASLRRWTPERNHADRLAAVLRTAPGGLERARLGYALFKELDDLARTDEAWAALTDAAAEARRAYRWSEPQERRLIDLLKATAAPSPARVPPRHIFVVGLPRSGTSLVERILGAHSQVQALGELGTFGALVNTAVAVQPGAYVDLAVAERLDRVNWPAIGAAYRDAVQRLAPGAAVTVDKLPQNWLYAGAIAQALPDAVIVHTNRGAMDNLFGCYRQLFQADFHWSYDLGDLAAHYAHYRELTGHWRDTLGPAWVEVDYEALAADPASEIPKLLADCGLPFEEACLHPERDGRTRSLSVVQLQEPINTRGIGAWRRFEAQLDPLRASLEGRGLL